MQVVKLYMVDNSIMVTLPTSVLEILHLHEDDKVVLEVTEDHIILSKASHDFQDA